MIKLLKDENVLKVNDDFALINDNSLNMLDYLEEESIDAIVCDPPYELGFMGKKWDSTGIAYNVDLWQKALRVLKKGGYLLAFGGSRTFHRIACAIEDAGFEIRDTIMWLYGSGFPKSHNIGKELEAKILFDDASGRSQKKLNGDKVNANMWTHHWSYENGKESKDYSISANEKVIDIDYQTEEGKQWSGYGTCLKPAYEPIIMARKPTNLTIAENCLKYGVGGINIDECRVPIDKEKESDNRVGTNAVNTSKCGFWQKDKSSGEVQMYKDNGRFPANVITDGSDEVASGMPNTKSSITPNDNRQNVGNSMFLNGIHNEDNSYNDEGSAMRYFYSAKASKKDRDDGLYLFENKSGAEISGRKEGSKGLVMENGKQNPYNIKSSPNNKNFHPTVKPVELMEYLVRLVSPKGSVVLDIFNGSGSTGKAVAFENRERNANYKYIGIELSKEYCEISKARIDYSINKFQYDIVDEIKENEKKGQLSLFDF